MNMPRAILGKTGLSVSVMGLGGGGASRLGQGTGKSRAESVAVVRRALDLGINLFDSAESYGTEELMGEALQPVPRGSVVVSTKKSTWKQESGAVTATELVEGLDASLRRLGTDHVDVYHLHGVSPKGYDRVTADLVPVLLKLKAAGKTRFIGVTEAFESDHGHAMAVRALADGWPDVIMTGFNILNQSARDRVLAPAAAKGIGILGMFAVRAAFSRPERLAEILADLLARGRLGPGLDDGPNPLGFLTAPGVAVSLPDAGYRFCRHEPGLHATLVGTGEVAHLEENAASFALPPLPVPLLTRLRSAFGAVDDVSAG